MQISKNSQMFSDQVENRLNDFCRPFFKATGITYFDFERYDINGELFFLSSEIGFASSIIEKQLYPFLSECMATQTRYSILSEVIPIPEPLLANEEKWLNNISTGETYKRPHRLFVVMFSENYMECFGLGASISSHKMFSFFMERIQIIEQFIFQFKHYFHDLINEVSNEKIYLDDCIDIKIESFIDTNSLKIDEKTLDQFNIPSFVIKDGDREVRLNNTELLHVAFMANGYTSKEIGRIFNLSHRTSDYHINKAKEKLDLWGKHQLRDIYHTTDLNKIISPSDLYCIYSQLKKTKS